MKSEEYWDDDAYVRIEMAHYDTERGMLTVGFVDGDVVTLAAWSLVRSTVRDPRWTELHVVDRYHISVPVAPGTGDAGGDTTDIPGMTVRSVTDPIFAAHLARRAEESAHRIGQRLQQLRQARGLTMAQVAQRVGMAQRNLSHIEQGRLAVSYPTLEKIVVAMGYTMADLIVSPTATASATLA